MQCSYRRANTAPSACKITHSISMVKSFATPMEKNWLGKNQYFSSIVSSPRKMMKSDDEDDGAIVGQPTRPKTPEVPEPEPEPELTIYQVNICSFIGNPPFQPWEKIALQERLHPKRDTHTARRRYTAPLSSLSPGYNDHQWCASPGTSRGSARSFHAQSRVPSPPLPPFSSSSFSSTGYP